MPAWLLWLCPVPLATMLAIIWASWSNRVRGPEEAIDTVVAYERFCRAMTSHAPVTPTQRVPVGSASGSRR